MGACGSSICYPALQDIHALPQEYNGFNLCVADLVSGEFGYLTNRGKGSAGTDPLKLEHRLYGLSNGVLQDMWPKVGGLSIQSAGSYVGGREASHYARISWL